MKTDNDQNQQEQYPDAEGLGYLRFRGGGVVGLVEEVNGTGAKARPEYVPTRHELLELARMQSGQLKIIHRSVDLSELLEHCHELFNIQAQEKGVIIKMKAESPVTVLGDMDRLEQLFSNLR